MALKLVEIALLVQKALVTEGMEVPDGSNGFRSFQGKLKKVT